MDLKILPFTVTWTQILLTLAGFLIMRVFWGYLKLWLYLQSLKKKGAEVYFQFPLGKIHQSRAATKKGDTFLWFKETIQKKPDLRIMASHFATKPLVYLVDPQLGKVFLSDTSKVIKSPMFGPLANLLQQGLLLSEGSQWKKHRKTLSTTFRYDFIISHLPTIVNTAREIFSREIEAQKGKNINILSLYQMITGELVFRIFFGEDLEGVTIDGIPPTSFLPNLLEVTLNNARSPENILFGMKGVKLGLFKRNRDYFEKSGKFLSFCNEMIHLKRQKLERKGNTSGAEAPDLLTLLLQGQKEQKGTSDEYSDEEILHEFVTFFFAGMDTTGHMMTLATYFFSQQSEEVQKAVLKEANELAQAGANLTSELLHKAETIHAFLKETLRMVPPTPNLLPREVVTETLQIEDLTIKKGTMVNVPFVAYNYNPKYHPDPYRFNMYRWIQGHPDFEEAVQKNPFIYTPFSAGPRNCIGQHLAMMEGKIIWSIFLSTYNFTVPAEYKMHYKVTTLYGPRETLYIDIEKKK